MKIFRCLVSKYINVKCNNRKLDILIDNPKKNWDQVGYPQEALPTRAGGTGPPRTGFLNVGPPKGQ